METQPSPTPVIPRGAIKRYREILNAQNAAEIAREAAKEGTDLTRKNPRHRNGRFHQVKRLYGDYLYAQDREKFMEELREWLACLRMEQGRS